MTYTVDPGSPLPMGSTVHIDGVNFSLFSRNAEAVTLVLLPAKGAAVPIEIPFDTNLHRTGDIWHMFVRGAAPLDRYVFRVTGPSGSKERRHLFDAKNLLIDPYSKAISGLEKWGDPQNHPYPQGLWGIIVDDSFDWEGDRPLKIPMKDSIIYELHLKGYTCHASSKVKEAGTYLGIVEKIPYLKKLGITALEFLPVTEFNEMENIRFEPTTQKRLKNFWGYSPVSFFSPKASYATNPWDGRQVVEFKQMVKELHRAGIEVILDIVFNHTAEGDVNGPILNFKGLDNTIYYMLDQESGAYKNYSGCGNTFNCNHPLVRKFIVDCLRYWVIEMHVDGFRFDLASILGRDQDGEVLSNPPVVELIAEDPVLADTKIIAEAWDAAGLYQVGSFSSHRRWAEWNGRFRDDVRSFLCGHRESVAPMATRIAGSSDLYQHGERRPFNSVNFITSHDGFTLYDLVSYNGKQNEANGEENRDGENNNISCNSGCEGPSRSTKIRDLRQRRMKTFAVLLFLSQGTPMMTAGDEFCRTQRGNNNAYCQDSPISWVDWRLAETNRSFLRFFTMLIATRKKHTVFRREDFFTAEDQSLTREIVWQSQKKGVEDWSAECRTLAFLLCGGCGERERDTPFFIMLNGDEQERSFELPPPPTGRRWRLLIDTAAAAPEDIYAEDEAPPVLESSFPVASMGAVVLMAEV